MKGRYPPPPLFTGVKGEREVNAPPPFPAKGAPLWGEVALEWPSFTIKLNIKITGNDIILSPQPWTLITPSYVAVPGAGNSRHYYRRKGYP